MAALYVFAYICELCGKEKQIKKMGNRFRYPKSSVLAPIKHINIYNVLKENIKTDMCTVIRQLLGNIPASRKHYKLRCLEAALSI